MYKVSHICSNFDSFFVDFMKQQEKDGLDFRTFYFRSRERGYPTVTAPNLDIRLNFNQWMRYFFFLKELEVLLDYKKFYKNEKFDLYHAHTLFSNGYIAYRLNKNDNKPYIVAVRDTDINVFFKYRPYLRGIGKKILLNSSHVVFISGNYKDELFDIYLNDKEKKIIEDKFSIIPNGINNYFLDNTYRRAKCKEKKVIKLLTVGHIMKRKNQLVVCEAIHELIKEGYNIEYMIVGKILDKKYFSNIKKYSFVTHVDFVEKEELLQFYRNSDVFIMPSQTETFGLTYIESLSQSLPIIYSKGQGVESYFKDGEVGKAVTHNSVKEIKKAILEISNDLDMSSDRLVSKSLEFNWERINKSYISIYESIIK